MAVSSTTSSTLIRHTSRLKEARKKIWRYCNIAIKLEGFPLTTLADAESRGKSIFEFLEGILEEEATKQGKRLDLLTQNLHVWPDFHGNRAPIADPTMKGMICGLTLDCGVSSLALLYLAVVQALAYGTRLIVDSTERCVGTTVWYPKQRSGFKRDIIC